MNQKNCGSYTQMAKKGASVLDEMGVSDDSDEKAATIPATARVMPAQISDKPKARDLTNTISIADSSDDAADHDTQATNESFDNTGQPKGVRGKK